MPDMDGFKLLEHVGLEMDLPVISKLLSIFILKTFPFSHFLLNKLLILVLIYGVHSDVC